MNKRITKLSEEVKLEKQKELYMLVKSIPQSDDPEEFNDEINLMGKINLLLMQLNVIPADLMMKFMTDQKLAVQPLP